MVSVSKSRQQSTSMQDSQTFQQAIQSGYFGDLMGRSQMDSFQQKSFFPGQNYADMSAATTGGIAGFQNQLGGGQALDAASGYAKDVLRGDYLNNNPYLDATFDQASRGMTRAYKSGVAGTQSGFDLAGRGASGSAMNARDRENDRFATNLGELSTSIYGGNYQQERGRQQQAMQGAGGIEAGFMNRFGGAINAGGAEEQLQMQQIMGNMQRFDFGQNEFTNRLSKFQGLLGGPIMENKSSGRSQSTGKQVSAGVFA